jgi:hypothetical protein
MDKHVGTNGRAEQNVGVAALVSVNVESRSHQEIGLSPNSFLSGKTRDDVLSIMIYDIDLGLGRYDDDS